jgi:galactokinase
VVTENARVLETVGLLRAGAAARCGPLLTASHASLRDDFEVSWPQADATVDAAVAGGALGARMTGGGFGGSVIVLVEAARNGDVRASIDDAFAGHGWKPPRYVEALPSAGAHRLR